MFRILENIDGEPCNHGNNFRTPIAYPEYNRTRVYIAY